MKKNYDKQSKSDAVSFDSAIKGKTSLDISNFKAAMVHELAANTDILTSGRIMGMDVEHILDMIKNPIGCGNDLISISRYLMNISSYYQRICLYLGNMGLVNWTVDTIDVKNDADNFKLSDLKNSYLKLLSQLEKMNLRHEFKKILAVLPSEDLFCGLLYENSSDFFIWRVPYNVCKIINVQDGVFNFGINLSAIVSDQILSYPDYVQEAYLAYRNKRDYFDAFYVPPAKYQICIKFNDTVPYVMPYMLMICPDIFDIDKYKKLKLQKARVNNYKAIGIEIPIDDESVDKPLLTDDIITAAAEVNKSNMPDDIGMIHTFGKPITPISFNNNTNETDNLSDAISNLYTSAGVPAQMFVEQKTSVALKLAIENDAGMIYRVYRQLERWTNRFIKLRGFNKSLYKFKLRIQDSTIFNRSDVTGYYLSASEHGLATKMDYAVSIGQTPGRFLGNLMIENDIFDISSNLRPLPTSYTQSSGDTEESGRPTNESLGLELSDEGEKTADNGGNDR